MTKGFQIMLSMWVLATVCVILSIVSYVTFNLSFFISDGLAMIGAILFGSSIFVYMIVEIPKEETKQ